MALNGQGEIEFYWRSGGVAIDLVVTTKATVSVYGRRGIKEMLRDDLQPDRLPDELVTMLREIKDDAICADAG